MQSNSANYNNLGQNLRLKLIESYPRHIEFQHFESSQFSLETFISMMTKWLQYANTPYLQKDNRGIFYAEDYVKHTFSTEVESRYILGLSHPSYWDISTHSTLFRAKEGHPVNKALSSFFHGPTFADCGNVVQACIYRAIEEMIGTIEFNRIFGMSLTPFLITPILYHKIYSETEEPEYSLDFRTKSGNPLLFLFDKISDNVNEEEIKPGDILYIKGVEQYSLKHLAGSGSGENVICIGKNENNENLYLGFGSGKFTSPLTYKEIKLVLIKLYNADHYFDTTKMIEKAGDANQTFNSELNQDQLKFNTQVFLAGRLANDEVNADSPIVGIQYVIRPNKEKFELFFNRKIPTWHKLSIDELNQSCRLKKPTSNNSVKQITAITVETRNKSFSDYEVKTTEQDAMLLAAMKFTVAACSARSTAIGFVMTGMPGVGKTHLSIAVANQVAKNGLKVVFVDNENIGNLYQKMCEQSSAQVSDSEMDKLFSNWLREADLIVLDDINSKYGIGARFLSMAIKYVMNNNKSIMISGNQPLHTIQESLPDYIGYDDERTCNFLIIQDIKGVSYRKTWWSELSLFSSSGVLKTNNDALDLLANINIDHPAGIILEEKNNVNLEKISTRYLELPCDKNVRIRILQEPHRNQHVFDLYIHDFDQHDVFFIKVDGHWDQCEQLLNLISHVHDLGKKIIVVTNDEVSLTKGIQTALDGCTLEKSKLRLNDRAANLLLKTSEWPTIIVKQCTFSKKLNEPTQARITIGPKANVSTSSTLLEPSSVLSMLRSSRSESKHSNQVVNKKLKKPETPIFSAPPKKIHSSSWWYSLFSCCSSDSASVETTIKKESVKSMVLHNGENKTLNGMQSNVSTPRTRPYH